MQRTSGVVRNVALATGRFQPQEAHSQQSDFVANLRRRLEEEVGCEPVERYFDGQANISLSDGKLVVSVASGFIAQIMEKRFGLSLRRVGGELAGLSEGIEVVFRIDRRVADEIPVETATPTGKATGAKTRAAAPSSKQTFANFLTGKSNKLAHMAAVRLAEESGPVPALFIHGACGMGKSHLLHAVANRMLELRPNACVRYTTAESFTNEFVAAIKANKVDGFRRAYRRVDLLCLDDVHFFGGKEATQNELLHTFDAVGLDGARIVMASDEHPRDIRKLSERLTSRFVAGMVVRVETPDRDLRERLIRHLAQRRGMELEDAALALIADRTERAIGTLGGFGGSVREIEGLLNQIDAVHRLLPELSPGGTKTGLLLVRRALGLKDADGSERADAEPNRPRRPIAPEVVIVEVCRALNVEVSDFQGKGRHPRVVVARALVAYLCRTLTTLSFPEIARASGRGNHSTVITAFRRFSQQMAEGHTLEPQVAPRFAGITLRELADQLARQIAKASLS